MQRSPASRFATIVAAGVAAFLLATSVSAAAPGSGAPLLIDRAAAAPATLPTVARTDSGVAGTLNPGALSARALELTLPDGTTLEAHLERVTVDAATGRRSWIGTFDDAPGSVLVLSRARGVVTGFANYKDEVLELRPAQRGRHVLYAVDAGKLPQRVETLVRPQTEAADPLAAAIAAATGGSTTTSADAVVQDILVLYTAATATRYGTATIESQIQSAVQAANQAYLNSQANITLNIVGLQQTTVVEQSSMGNTLGTLETDPGVAQLRDQVGADVVVLVSEDTSACGISNVMTTNSTSFAPYAFSVVNSGCLSNQSLAHEVGHQQGLVHDHDSTSFAGVSPYSYGYRLCVTDGTGFRDVMAYPCTGAPRVLLFSNPNITWNGHPAGVSYALDPANAAEAAHSLNDTAVTVASFRSGGSTSTTGSTSGSGGTAPAAPSGLAVQQATYASVTLGWTDNSTDESGFKVERSSDGVTFAEIATLGANTVSFVDSNVAPKSSYYYRVRAFNSYGVSAYSATVSVTTPDAPPPAPTGVSALDNADGSATVSWTVGTTNATGYTVQRETYDPTTATWGSATTAATVPASTLSIVDLSGVGTFRYSVRATNSGGSSAWAGPAQVTVTNATTTTTTKKSKGRKR